MMCLKEHIDVSQAYHTLALMSTKIAGDLMWHMGEKAPLPFENSGIC